MRPKLPIVTMQWIPGIFSGGGWSFVTPDFKRAWVEEFKQVVPVDYRSYKPEGNVWYVDWQYGQDVAALLEEFFKADIYWNEEAYGEH